jgi:hypothetical protein
MLARIAIIAITTSSSIRVNAEEVLLNFICSRVASAQVIAVSTEIVNNYFPLIFQENFP